MKPVVIALFLLCSNAFGGSVFIAYVGGNIPVNASIDINAEYVALPITVTSDARQASERASLIRQAQSTIQTAAAATPGIEYEQGAISLSPRDRSSFSISKSYGRGEGSRFYVLSKLESGEDIYTTSQKIYSFIRSITIPDDTGLSLGETSLAIDSPASYRSQLLTKISEELQDYKSIFGADYRVKVSGLESPVLVKEKNHRQVTLFIDYRIEINE